MIDLSTYTRLTHPPASEVREFWETAQPITLTPPPDDADAFVYLDEDFPDLTRAGKYLRSRGFDPWTASLTGIVRSAPEGRLSRWPAQFERPDWFPYHPQTWPLWFLAYNFRGEPASVHARAVDASVIPKSRWAKGHNSAGLLFADTIGASFLSAQSMAAPATLWRPLRELQAVIVVEGPTDTLKMALVVDVLSKRGVQCGVLGYVTGSQVAIARINWPSSVHCIIATDNDESGDGYAIEIEASIKNSPRVFRLRPPQQRRSDGAKGGDWSDLTEHEVVSVFGDAKNFEVRR